MYWTTYQFELNYLSIWIELLCIELLINFEAIKNSPPSNPYFHVGLNDLPDNISSEVRLFADDCVLYRPIHSNSDVSGLQLSWSWHSNIMAKYVANEIQCQKMLRP